MSDGYKNRKIKNNNSFVKKNKIKKKNFTIALNENLVYRYRHARNLAKTKGIDLGATLEKDILKLVKAAEKKLNINDSDWKNVKKCPKCNSELVLRNYKNSSFYGCSTFPKCNFTMSLDNE